MNEDMQNYCRLCLDVESSHVSIFGDPTISIHLRSCLSLSVSPNDQLPTDICMSCVSQLSQFYHFQINARCSQDWLESSLQEKSKKGVEKAPIQPLPDSEYNSDSLLEFLNNTANIEEYLNNLGKDDIPSIVNMLDKHEHFENARQVSMLTSFKSISNLKQPSPKKKELKAKNGKVEMEIDVLDSDFEIVKEIILKKVEPKTKQSKSEVNFLTCYGCKLKFDSILKLSHHVGTCDNASRTCTQCCKLFDSRQKMIEHSVTHASLPLTCTCGDHFQTKDKLIQHKRNCKVDSGGCTFRCKECKHVFNDRYQLFKHVKSHVVKLDEKKCDICSHIFLGNDALAKHKKKEHEGNINATYRCKVCGITSKDHHEMVLHITTHTNIPEQTCHLCETCGKSFSSKSILVRHSLQHNKKYKCDICSKCFKDLKDKERHRAEHNELAMCDKCGQTVNSQQFDVHLCVS